MVRLNVPLFRQSTPHHCVPACYKMVLEHLREAHGEKIPKLSIKKIAQIIRTEIGGTRWVNLTRINEALLTSFPSVEFVPEYPCDWKEVENENTKGKPIIVWIWLSDDRGLGCGHSVVVFDIDRSEGVVHYNDPARGIIHEDIGTFISKWENENVNKSLIKVKVGERIQRKLPEYTKMEGVNIK